MRHRLIASTVLGLLIVGCSESAPAKTTGARLRRIRPGARPRSRTLRPAQAAANTTVKVNLNTATREQFLALPEVTSKMAHEFDEYRPYASIRQFRREIGKYVDAAQIARYEKFVFVPIAVNESDAETLAQIPGLDAETAGQIIEERPYATTEDFLAAVAALAGDAAAAAARGYIAE